MPAIIVENILWSTLFLVCIDLNVLTWIVFSSYLVSDKCVCVCVCVCVCMCVM